MSMETKTLTFKIQTLARLSHPKLSHKPHVSQKVFVRRLCREILLDANISAKRRKTIRMGVYLNDGSYFHPKPPGVDARGAEQEAAQAAVGVTLVFVLRAGVWKRLDDLHKGLWENSSLVVDCAL